MELPSELLYSEEHEWIKVDNNKATIGITEFAQIGENYLLQRLKGCYQSNLF